MVIEEHRRKSKRSLPPNFSKLLVRPLLPFGAQNHRLTTRDNTEDTSELENCQREVQGYEEEKRRLGAQKQELETKDTQSVESARLLNDEKDHIQKLQEKAKTPFKKWQMNVQKLSEL